MNNTQRTSEEIYDSLKNGGFVTNPQDVFTIVQTTGVISNRVDLHLTNAEDGTDARFSVSNIPAAWRWLKQLSEITARLVRVQTGDGEFVDFKDSEPYKCRFK